MNAMPSHTAKQILAANNKAYPLRRLRINFICTNPPPVFILGKDVSKSIVRKDEFKEKAPHPFG
jgi:hypothetical protein